MRTGSRFLTTYHWGRLQVSVRVEVVDAVTSAVMADALARTTGSEEVICTTTDDVWTDPPPPSETDCGPDTEAEAVARSRWSTLQAALATYTWTPLTSAQDSQLVADIGADLTRFRQTGYGYVLNAMQPDLTQVVDGRTVTIPHGAELMTQVDNLNAARTLLASYVELGLPQELMVDTQLRQLIHGGIAPPGADNPFADLTTRTYRLPDQVVGTGEHLRSIYSRAVSNGTEAGDSRVMVDNLVRTRIGQLVVRLREHVTDTATGGLSSTALDSTMTRLALTEERLTSGAGPVAAVTSGPSGTTSVVRPSFAFSSGEPAAHECRFVPVGGTAPAFAPCLDTGTHAGTHTATADLADGAWRFEVRSTDRSGAVGPVDSRDFTIAATAPPVSGTTFVMGARPKISGKPGSEDACASRPGRGRRRRPPTGTGGSGARRRSGGPRSRPTG